MSKLIKETINKEWHKNCSKKPRVPKARKEKDTSEEKDTKVKTITIRNKKKEEVDV